MDFNSLKPFLDEALASRLPTIDSASEKAFRLFNGFYEGYPSLAVDVYSKTLLIHDYADQANQNLINEVVDYLQNNLNWLRAGILKTMVAGC